MKIFSRLEVLKNCPAALDANHERETYAGKEFQSDSVQQVGLLKPKEKSEALDVWQTFQALAFAHGWL